MNSRSVMHRPALTVLLLVPGVLAAVLTGCGGGSAATSGSSAGSPVTTASGAATATPSAGSAAPTTPASSTPGSGPASTPPGHPATTTLVPLWPFTTLAEAQQWQAAYRSSGHQPWHLDAGQTALSFTRGHLGYADVDRVTSRSIRGADARVGVGWHVPGTRNGTAAVLHLIRLGSGSDAPWVVVGSDDTDLTLAVPRYGSTVASPVTVGGRITGVDENLRVIVVGPTSPRRLFVSAGLPAGGVRTPWSTVVRFEAPRGSVLTIAVSTGGHLQQVERFAITAVTAR